ncbi:MAG: MFS transporter [Bacillota bacterium]|nr:MFS transporter [Bacillota bacterium]
MRTAGYRYFVVRYVLAVGAVEFFAFKMLDPFYLQFLTTERGIGLTPGQFATFVALGGWVTMALDYLTGAVADRAGRRATWAAALFVYAGAMFWLSRAMTFRQALTVPILQGISWALSSGSREAWLYDHAGQDGTRRAMAALYLYSVPLTLAGAGMATWLGTRANIRAPIALTGAIILGVGLLVLTFPENYGSRARRWREVLASGLGQFRSSRVLQLLALQSFFMTLPIWINSAWWLTFVVEEWHVNPARVALSFGITATAAAGAGLILSRMKVTRYRALLVYPTAAAAAAYLLMALATVPAVFVCLVVVAVASSYFRSTGIALLRNEHIREERATALSFLSTLEGAFWVVGPLLWGVLIGRAGMRVSFVVASICCVASMGLLLLAMRAHASMGRLDE